MPDTDKTAILIRALEASGSEREAQLARAILGDPAATPAAPAEATAAAEIPAAATVPAPVAASAAEQGPQPPPGKAPLQTLDDWEALSEREQLARMDEVDELMRQGQR
jgi:hypothetical protein